MECREKVIERDGERKNEMEKRRIEGAQEVRKSKRERRQRSRERGLRKGV